MPTRQQKKKVSDAYLFGPFIGELSWELYRFAPYAIHLKKINPRTKLIVLTRKERFDLYGKYADILVPLYIKHDKDYQQEGFGLLEYETIYYNTIAKYFVEKYEKKYNIKDHFFPIIDSWKKHIKWQFPRSKMDYNFIPRVGNYEIVDKVVKKKNFIFIDKGIAFDSKDNILRVEDFLFQIINEVDNLHSTFLGCLIVALQRSKYVIGNLQNYTSQLAILLKVPLLVVDEQLSDDAVCLLNPLNTTIIRCSSADEGVKFYENNF